MTRLSQILLAIKSRIELLCELPGTKVAIVARRDVPNLGGERDVLIRVRPATFDPAHSSRHDCRIRRVVDLTLRYRFAGDKVGDDISWMTKESLGFLEFENSVINACQLFEPVTPGSNPVDIGVQPMRVLSITEPSKDRTSADNWTWGEEVIAVELIYAADVDQSII